MNTADGEGRGERLRHMVTLLVGLLESHWQADILNYQMKQLLLMPDPKPLVERLGPDFFAQAPECPGVYLMRDAVDRVLYVGKAKNLRKRLGSYRVANPDRLRRRHLRLLRAVERIDLQECPDETTALVRESELLRNLRPAYN